MKNTVDERYIYRGNDKKFYEQDDGHRQDDHQSHPGVGIWMKNILITQDYSIEK